MRQSKGLNELKGIKTFGLSVGLKRSGRPDLAIIQSEYPLSVVGMFTKNKVKAAPVVYAHRLLPSDSIRLFLINSGIANALTGEDGLEDLRAVIKFYAKEFGIEPQNIIMSSTGVIGKRLDIGKICEGAYAVKHTQPSSFSAAQAIMTTDTKPKLGFRRVYVTPNKFFEIAYMAKGAGMIAPNLATMLIFIGTDVNLPLDALKMDLQRAVDNTINHITVDGDMSTNDSVFLFSTKQGPTLSQEERKIWYKTLEEVCYEIAEQIVRDGEGATKFVRIDVFGARTQNQAKKAAFAVANSLLVKTALFGEDPNFGRIAAAVGYSGAQFNTKYLAIEINGFEVVKNGVPAEKVPAGLLKTKDIAIKIYLNAGKFSYFVLTSDLSYEYVKINAEYHT